VLVIEVSDSSLEYDRDEKLPRYAHAHISEVWIVGLSDQTIEQYTQPRRGKYLVKRILEVGDTLVSSSVPALTIELATVFA
jgi:Uma2 family endonuclease